MSSKRTGTANDKLSDYFTKAPDMPFTLAVHEFSRMLSPLLNFGSNNANVKNVAAAALLRHMFTFKTPMVQMHGGEPKLTTVGLALLADMAKTALDKGFRNMHSGSLTNRDLLTIGTALRADLDPSSEEEADILKLAKKAEAVHREPVTLSHFFLANARKIDAAIS